MPGSDPVVVVIQPSMGFGTGHHATTRLTLKALQELPLAQSTVLDIGCGSGVLAIAAVKLGAQSAIGIDIDPDALEMRGKTPSQRRRRSRAIRGRRFPRDVALAAVVMANLTGGLLERSAATLGEMVAPGGFLIVSGFMDTEKDRVIPALERILELQTLAQEEEWLCAVLARRR